MARILRGEIRWADLNPVRGKEQAGLRPVLILSHDVFNERSGTVIAVALTSQPQRAGFPLLIRYGAIELERAEWPGLRVESGRIWCRVTSLRIGSMKRLGYGAEIS
ncbi:MAG: type II toxin-antitoxin system PemK/MazF family toxin [Deltaproteobacteria bacterium]|nr:MAG: type II toxin-antitoxin system PemK/MazF family toxin [Deltaproteobacteria bacterium]